jgi:hypothetical protein
MTTKRRVIVAVTAVLALTGLAACSKNAAAEKSEAPAAEAASRSVETIPAPPQAQDAGSMPDVVCMDLQTAQDTIQATTDLFFSDSHDATGRDRNQLVDSNWLVVDQSPAAGTTLHEDDVPMLDVVKFGEGDCK